MAGDNTIMVAGAAGIAGAIISAIGNALGFSRRISKVEEKVETLQKCKSTYLTKEEHDVRCTASKELTNEKLRRMDDKLDMILDRINHCRYNSMSPDYKESL